MSFNDHYDHAQLPTNSSETAIILCNLGTPEAPTASAVRRYLAQFLSDQRVVEIPRAIWLIILHGIILRTRPAKTAAKYASVWLPGGSPLMVWTQKQAAGLQELLQDSTAQPPRVYYAMRYGQPSVESVLSQARADGAKRIFILPMYPQYSGTTTASLYDSWAAWSAEQRNLPDVRILSRYHDHPAYIAALAAQVQAHWAQHGRAQMLLLSFHGVPERNLQLGDPYHCECLKTARLLAQALGLEAGQWQASFQSRFGKAKWVGPATDTTLAALPARGIQSLDVFCPGFPSDCLETLEEIAIEGQEIFMHAGGSSYRYIPCMNDSAPWLAALLRISQEQIGDWLRLPPADAAALQEQARLAQAQKPAFHS